ncbi:hypothetical protein CH363_05435 [Leptospira haakeii]|uniref:Lipoprotein n=1 Tax=Leptospira haakeii TaxID=2023198 RepID=A0ABX4PMH7_9LEPT|nr:hypothetical protein CH363_05435 [Leptospira haakeii]PKA19269.1 hypothetical protein CH377_13165 [Leptospira haakeii]
MKKCIRIRKGFFVFSLIPSEILQEYTIMNAKFLFNLLFFFAFFSCKGIGDFQQTPNSLALDHIRCDQILNEITIKNRDSDPVILLNTALPSIERNHSEAKLGYFFGSAKNSKTSEEQTKNLAKTISLILPGQSHQLKIGEDFENINSIDTFRVSIGYSKMEKGKFSQTGLKISPDLAQLQSIQDFEIDCRDISKL